MFDNIDPSGIVFPDFAKYAANLPSMSNRDPESQFFMLILINFSRLSSPNYF